LQTAHTKKILIAPLDWGLGHTTRCLPIVRYLQQLGHHPIVAGNDRQRAFLEQSIPGITTIELPGYDIRYSGINKLLQAGLLMQLPRAMRSMAREHTWLKKQVAVHNIDGVISDNRYGLHHASVHTAIITHQPHVLSGAGALADGIVRRLHYKLLSRFGQVWIADAPGTPNLAGKLSHPATLPARATHIGLLSRYMARPITEAEQHLLILLSGPEPLRAQLSALLWRQVRNYPGRVVFVEGTTDAECPTHVPNHINWHPILAGDDLELAIAHAQMVVCRSGYSTIMDLVALGRKAIIVPTPGQTEQRHLGASLHDQGILYCASQKGFSLQRSIDAADHFPYHTPHVAQEYHRFKPVIDQWLTTL
jgi:hypothetical protein